MTGGHVQHVRDFSFDEDRSRIRASKLPRNLRLGNSYVASRPTPAKSTVALPATNRRTSSSDDPNPAQASDFMPATVTVFGRRPGLSISTLSA